MIIFSTNGKLMRSKKTIFAEEDKSFYLINYITPADRRVKVKQKSG